MKYKFEIYKQNTKNTFNTIANGWEQIDQADPDDEPLSKEELRQLNSDAGYVTGEEAKREFGLQVDLP